MEKETTLTNTLPGSGDEVGLDASQYIGKETRRCLHDLGYVCLSICANGWVEIKKALKCLLVLKDDVALEFKPILKHGILAGLTLRMLAGLYLLFITIESPELRNIVQKVDSVLYTTVYVYLGISTVIRLLLSFLDQALPKLRRILSIEGVQPDGRTLLSGVWKEFYPILKHGIISALIYLMLTGSRWLANTIEPTTLTQNIQKVESVVYSGVYIYVGIATFVELLLILLELVLPGVRGLRSKETPQTDGRKPIGSENEVDSLIRGVQIPSPSAKE